MAKPRTLKGKIAVAVGVVVLVVIVLNLASPKKTPKLAASAATTTTTTTVAPTTTVPATTTTVLAGKIVTLGAGSWTVGKDVQAGRYVVTPGAGESGGFAVAAEGIFDILGTLYNLPSVTVTLKNGDVVIITSMSSVTLTPTGA